MVHPNGSPQRLLIRKRNGIWKIVLLVRVAGAWFPYATGGAGHWNSVPAAAGELWEMRPGP